MFEDLLYRSCLHKQPSKHLVPEIIDSGLNFCSSCSPLFPFEIGPLHYVSANRRFEYISSPDMDRLIFGQDLLFI